MKQFEERGVRVVGVSPDSVKSHGNFREKHAIGITLLSDPDKSVSEAYGAYGEKKMYGKTVMGIIRSTFLIAADGTIENVWRNVKVAGHAEKVLDAIS